MKRTYFTHDFGARNDPKLQNVLMTQGCAGIGIYWCIVEMMYEQGGVLEMNACKSIAFALHTECSTVESIVNDFGLFECGRGKFWSKSLKARIDRQTQIVGKRKSAAMKRWGGNAEMEHETAESEQDKAEIAHSDAELERKTTAGQEAEAAPGNDAPAETKEEAVKPTTSGRTKGDSGIDYARIADMYHGICKSYPKLLKFSDERKAKVRIRFHDEMKCDYALLEDVFRKMEESKFLRGDNKNGWKATFDWLFANPKNWVKVAEGNYDNRESGTASASPEKEVNSLWNQPQQ